MVDHDVTERATRPTALAEGLLAGLALGALDWVATGVARVPLALLGLILAWGLLSGLLAGAVASLLRRRGVALGLVVLGATALHGGSTLTKSLDIAPSSAAGLATLAGVLVVAMAGGIVAARGRARSRGWSWPVVVLAAVPGASLLWDVVPPTPLALVLTCALPLVLALAWALPLPTWSGAVALPVAILALAAPSLVDAARAVGHRPPAPASARAPADSPNIILVVVDTLRWDHAFPADPADAPPHLQALADRGVRFDQAIASASWTLPSMSSLLTSLHPSHHRAVTKEHRLPDDVDTLAELLHAAGYETAAFTGGAFVSPAFGLGQGFEVFEQDAEYHFQSFRGHIPFAWRLIKNRWLPLRMVLRHVSEFGGVPRLRERVSAWLARRDDTRPFFLLVHTYQVHDYYIYQAAPDDPLIGERGGPPASVGSRLLMHPSELVVASQEQLDWYHDLYRGRLEYVDVELGRLLERVEAAVGPRGLVGVLTSDHGEGFDAERRRVHHGGRLHDDLLRVPLVLWGPDRLEAGQTIAEQVRLLDVTPTLLELAGVDRPEGLAGRSLLSLVARTDEEPRLAWSENHDEDRQISLRTPVWKVLDGRGGVELYRLDIDPLEDTSLDGQLPAELDTPWEARAALLAPREGVESAADAATLEQLRLLGY